MTRAQMWWRRFLEAPILSAPTAPSPWALELAAFSAQKHRLVLQFNARQQAESTANWTGNSHLTG